MRASADRSIRFVFDDVADAYVHGRPEMPLEVVLAACDAVGTSVGARVLEIGAGAGQLTRSLVAAGLDVVALEPGDALRAHAQRAVPDVEFRSGKFESFEDTVLFDAVFSANAFHWLDPELSYGKAAALLKEHGALILMWDMPFIGDARLHRRVQRMVMEPRGSEFPDNEAGVRELFESEAAAGRAELAASDLFEAPWWNVSEQLLTYTPEQYASLLQSLSTIAKQGKEVSAELRDALLETLGTEPFTVVDLLYVVAARRK